MIDIRMLGHLAEMSLEAAYERSVRKFGERFAPGDKPVLTTAVLYIGLGDQFDDDRRLVRTGARGRAREIGDRRSKF